MVAVVGEVNLINGDTAGLLITSRWNQKASGELEREPVAPSVHWQGEVDLLPLAVRLVFQLEQRHIIHPCSHCCHQELRLL